MKARKRPVVSANLPQPGATPSLQLLKEVRILTRECRTLKKIVGDLNRRLIRLEKEKPDADQ